MKSQKTITAYGLLRPSSPQVRGGNIGLPERKESREGPAILMDIIAGGKTQLSCESCRHMMMVFAFNHEGAAWHQLSEMSEMQTSEHHSNEAEVHTCKVAN